ncbi:hypothetical protein Tco_1181039 [Tanacetum coccineum]
MDKSMMGDLSSLPAEDQARMATMIDQLQVRDRTLDAQPLHKAIGGGAFGTFDERFLALLNASCVYGSKKDI